MLRTEDLARAQHTFSPVTRAKQPRNAGKLDIRLFGGLEVRRDGEVLALPQSKKTRALLAFLVLKGAPQRRDALCELLWEVPDDPRAALRWSLSKLRPLVNGETMERLIADRERVSFDVAGAVVDIARAEEACATGLEHQSREDLLDLCALCNGTLLAGLDLPGQPAYESWRLAQQERARKIHLRILDELLSRESRDASERARFLRRRIELDPDNEDAHLALVANLAASGQRVDAERQADISQRMLQAVGTVDRARFEAALRCTGKKTAVAKPRPATTNVEGAKPTPHQDIRFCTAADGVRIAYATAGSGPPLVKTANWMNHLEFDWESPIWRETFRTLCEENTFIRYDSRGNGLSDWNVENLSLDAWVEDLRAVVDAAGVERFPLLAISQGCAVAIEYAARYPERVSKLILYGGYAQGWRKRADTDFAQQTEALITLTRTGWGRDNPAYRQVFTSLFVPGGTPEQMGWFNELQRITTSPENAAAILNAHGDIDVLHRLKDVKQPTLVVHARGDQRVPYVNGRQLAMNIPGARFVTLESQNHVILDQEPAWQRLMSEIKAFLAQ